MSRNIIIGVVVVAIIGGGAWLASRNNVSESETSVEEKTPADSTITLPEMQPATDDSGVTHFTEDLEVVNKAEVAPVDLAPDFTLLTPAGETITLSDSRGQKSVILDFWASWCPNCQRDMPKLSNWYEQYGDDVEVIGVNLQEENSIAQGFIDRKKIAFPVVMDPSGQVSQSYNVAYTNYHVLINKDGSVASVVPGDISESDITELIASNQ